MSKILLPRFLTEEVAQNAFETVRTMMITGLNGGIKPFSNLKRTDLHIIILVPAMIGTENEEGYPNYGLKPHILIEQSLGDKKKWDHPYDEIARCKALQIWHDRNDGSYTQPHLLFPNDTPYFGGVKMDGIVVGCSGVQPWFDQMIARVIACLCIGQARHDWEESRDNRESFDFLK